MAIIASSAPAVLIPHVAANTRTIRLGAGGVMLPNHAPLIIAEQYGTLAELHPGRIDLGLGRAPGTDQNTLRALRRTPNVAKSFPQDVLEPAHVNGERWSYCDSKLNRIKYKKSIADAAVDGEVPDGNLRSPAPAQADLMAWLERLDRGETAQIERRAIVVPLDGDDGKGDAKRLRKYGDFSVMNARWNGSNSTTTAKRLTESPEEWEQYHALYRKARVTWTIMPFKEIIAWAKVREDRVIGDFGCGEALLAQAVGDRHVVHSFDHVAIKDGVIAGDMAHTPLEDGCLDVAVFCLSLMGANFTDYLREAHRTLKRDGVLFVWEARSRFDDPAALCHDLERLGFKVYVPEERGQFVFIEGRKTESVPDREAVSFRG